VEHLDACILCQSPRVEALCLQNSFFQCRTCGLVYDNPRPTWAQIVQFYSQENKYDDWLAEEKERDALWQRRLRLVRRHKPSGSLLDVGTGIGQFLNFAKAHYEVSGTEISPVAVEIAREKYGLEIRPGLLQDMKWEKRFDVITLFHVLEHVPYPAETLRLCHSLLQPGGILVIAVPNDVQSILTRRNRLMERLGFQRYRSLGKVGLPKLVLNGSEIHLSHFTSPVLRTALTQAGLEVIREGLDPYFSVAGLRKMRRFRRYYWYQSIHAVTGKNLYDTIWMVGRCS
jgi:SAM-dependent methyltransferase